ncbi:hypothetical protein D3C76_997240 [compost metagenome]
MVGGHDRNQVIAKKRQFCHATRHHAVVDDRYIEPALHQARVNVIAGHGHQGDFDVGPQAGVVLDERWNPAKRAVGSDAHAHKSGDAAGHGPGFGLGLIEDRDDVLGGSLQAYTGRAAIDAFHAAALASGGTDEGAPGPRGWAPNAYAAYSRDLDGNKLAAYCFKPD